MFTLLAALTLGHAQITGPGVEVTGLGVRQPGDVEVFVRRDGEIFVADTLTPDNELITVLNRLVASQRNSGLPFRVVVTADDGADWQRVSKAVDAARTAGAPHVALETRGGTGGVDPLFPGADGAIELGDVTQEELEAIAPKRHKFPQNPYTYTDFTAYTLELGEARLGLMNIHYGILPRTQIGTSPLLDLLGIYNGSLKVNAVREGRFDLALGGQIYVVPVSDLLRRLDIDDRYKLNGKRVDGQDLFINSITYASLGAKASLQVAGGWSVHGGVSYARAGGEGNIDFRNLPVVLLPGLAPVGGDLTVVPKVVGELVQVSVATDYRFNRRDGIIFQFAAPVYARARGSIAGDLAGLPNSLDSLDFVVSYGSFLPPSLTYRASLSYQASWKQVDLRFGVGSSAIPYSWIIEAFDVAYRFGGRTRRTETDIRKGYRENRKEAGEAAL